MGLMDKLKETAQDVASEARKATVQSKSKVEELAVRRKMDDRARQLGYLVFRERTQGTPGGADADALVAEMRDMEDQIARNAVDAAPDGGGEPEPEARDETGGGGSEPEASRETEGAGMEQTRPGAPPAQSPPEGSPTDQASP